MAPWDPCQTSPAKSWLRLTWLKAGLNRSASPQGWELLQDLGSRRGDPNSLCACELSCQLPDALAPGALPAGMEELDKMPLVCVRLREPGRPGLEQTEVFPER